MYADRATAYAQDVVDGKVPACKTHRQACARHLADLKRDDLEWMVQPANDACHFIENLPHVKGRWASKRETLKLEPWQVFIVASIFGWYKDGARRYTEAYIEVPRKNGKSTLAAAIALYVFCKSDDLGAEVYSGATTERQAWEVFRPAREMVARTPDLREAFDINVAAKTMFIMSNGNRFEPLIGKPGDGASPALAVVDEYHEHDTDDLYDTMRTGMGARDEPIMLVITTAGDNLGGPCYAKRADTIRVINGEVEDDSAFGIIFGIDEGDEWDTLEAAQKANPNFGVSINERFIEQQLGQARRSASKQNSYKTKHLNAWVGAKCGFLNMLAWQRQRKDFTSADLAGCKAWLGVDLASKKDVAAISAIVQTQDGWHTFQRFFVPEECENEKWLEYATDGHMVRTPGSATDYAFIEEELLRLTRELDCQDIGFDPWQAQYLMQRMAHHGLPVVEFPHQVRTFSDPMKEIEAMILDRKLWHDGNPCMTWMAGNVVVKADAKENIYPTKSRPDAKIDGFVALVMATGLMLREKNNGTLDEWLSDGVFQL